jgi:hypothetical protein
MSLPKGEGLGWGRGTACHALTSGIMEMGTSGYNALQHRLEEYLERGWGDDG